MTTAADTPNHLTFTNARDADPVRFRESCARGALACVASRDHPKPPAWLYDMSAAEFEQWLKQQEADRS